MNYEHCMQHRNTHKATQIMQTGKNPAHSTTTQMLTRFPGPHTVKPIKARVRRHAARLRDPTERHRPGPGETVSPSNRFRTHARLTAFCLRMCLAAGTIIVMQTTTTAMR